jgi:DNA polymerase I-like protein with 3'-5' exonuclease and polymerase domains
MSANIIILCEPPQNEEQWQEKKVLTGTARTIMEDALEAGGLKKGDYAFRFLASPVGEYKLLKTPTQIKGPYLEVTVPRIVKEKPLVIVTVGANPLKSVSENTKKLSDYQYKAFANTFVHNGEEHSCMVFPIPAPGYIFFNDHLMPEYQEKIAGIKALLKDYDQKLDSAVAGGMGEYKILTDFDACVERLEFFSRMGKAGKVIAFDTETSHINPHTKKARVGVISLSHKPRTGTALCFGLEESEWSKQDLKLWKKIVHDFFSQDFKWVAQNGKFDCKWMLKHYGVRIKLYADTMLMHFLRDEERGTHGLKQQAVKYTDMGGYEDELALHIPDKSEPFAFLKPPTHVVGMYAACLRRESLVKTVEHGWQPIAKLVNSKFSGLVYGLSKNGTIVETPVTGWVKNSVKQVDWYRVRTKYGAVNGRWGLLGPVFTPDHKIITNEGKIRVDSLVAGKHHVKTEFLTLSEDQLSIFLACLLGDGGIETKNYAWSCLRFSQAEKRKDYAAWKSEALKTLGSQFISVAVSKRERKTDVYRYRTPYSPYISYLVHKYPRYETSFHATRKLIPSVEVLNSLGDLGVAVWLQDDWFSVKGGTSRLPAKFTPDDLRRVISWFVNRYGVKSEDVNYNVKGRFIYFSRHATTAIINRVGRYFHPSCVYKTAHCLGLDHHSLSRGLASIHTQSPGVFCDPVVEVIAAPPSQYRTAGSGIRYCLTVPETGNFLTSLGFVSNCDADATIRLYREHRDWIKQSGNKKWHMLAFSAYPKISDALMMMEYHGAKVDLSFARKYKEWLENKSNEVLARIRSHKAVKKFISFKSLEADSTYEDYVTERKQKYELKLLEYRAYIKACKKEGKKPTRKQPSWNPDKLKDKGEAPEFNVNSVDQLRAVMFDYIKHEIYETTDSGEPSTGKASLIHYKNFAKCKLSADILEYRLWSKTLGTYIAPMEDLASGYDTGSFIYGNFNQLGTASGRASASSPNLQNVPAKGGGGVKRCYVSRFASEGGYLIFFDFSQIELRLAASLSRDKVMCKIYSEHGDIHTETTKGIYNLTDEELKDMDPKDKKEKRKIGKTYNFATCLLEGTPILTSNGWKRIEEVTTLDMVWDGAEWVSHSGVVNNGVRDTIDIGNVWCTVDHQILTNQGWVTACQYTDIKNPLSGTLTESGQFVISSTQSSVDSNPVTLHANVVPVEILTARQYTTFSTEKVCPVLTAGVSSVLPKSEQPQAMRTSCQAEHKSEAGLVDMQPSWVAAISHLTHAITITVPEALKLRSACATSKSSCDSSSQYRDGISQDCLLTVSTMTVDTTETTSGLYQWRSIYETPDTISTSLIMASVCASLNSGENTVHGTPETAQFLASSGKGYLQKKSSTSSDTVRVRTGNVYDIVNAGPRSRFQAGRHIVHNCYGSSPRGIVQLLAKDDPPTIISDEEAQENYDNFKALYKGLFKYIEGRKKFIRDHGYAECRFGMWRRLPMVNSEDEANQARAMRQGVNSDIQGTAGMMMLCCLVVITEEFENRKLKSIPFVTVHDSVGFDIYPGEGEIVAEIANRVMSNPKESLVSVVGADFDWSWLCVPIEASWDVGYNWRDMIQVGEETEYPAQKKAWEKKCKELEAKGKKPNPAEAPKKIKMDTIEKCLEWSRQQMAIADAEFHIDDAEGEKTEAVNDFVAEENGDEDAA